MTWVEGETMRPSVALARPSVVIALNVVVAGLMGAAFAFSHRLFGTGDEMAHVDYAYQLWQGRLPLFGDGLALDPGFGFRPPDQWVSQHPPLYYAAAAPLVGPLVEHGHILAAGYAARAVSAVFAGLLVVAVTWLAREVAPGRRRFWLIAGTVTAVHPAVVFIAGSAYNDNAFLVPATALLAITVRMVRRGVDTRGLILFAATAAVALLARSSAVVVIGICGLVLLTCLARLRPLPWSRIVGLAAAGVLALIPSSWFYLRNLEQTGNLIGSRAAEDISYMRHRVTRSMPEVLADPEVWRQWHLVWGSGVVSSSLTAALLVGVPLLLAVMLLGRRLLRSRSFADAAIAALFVGLTCLVILMQAEYVAQRGGASWRYLMPLIPVTSLAVAWAVTAHRRWQVVLVPLWVAGAALPMAIEAGRSLVGVNEFTTAEVFPGATTAALLLAGAAIAAAVVGALAFGDEDRHDGANRVFAADRTRH